MSSYKNSNSSSMDGAARDETVAPLLSSGATAAALPRNDDAAVTPTTEGVVAGEALPLTCTSKGFGGRTTSVPAVAAGHDNLAGTFTERLRRGLPVLGISVASLAVTGLAAGEPTTAAGFGLFLMLIVGLSTVTIRALRG